MGILDDAIREHLDLKRKHGAREGEVREIEDDAFGGGDRPDPFAAGELFGQTAAPSSDAPAAGDEDPTTVQPEASAGPAAPPAEPSEAPSPPEPGPELFDQSSGEIAQVPVEEPPAPEPPPAPAPEPPEPAPPEPSAPPEPAEPAAGTDAPAPLTPEPEDSAPASPPPDAPAIPSAPREAEPPMESESIADLMAQEEEEQALAEPPPPPAEDTAVRPAPPEPPVAPEPPTPPEPAEAAEPVERPAEPKPVKQPELGDEAAVEGDLEPDLTDAAEPVDTTPDPPPPPPEPGTEPPGRARGRVHHATEEHPAPDPPSEEALGPPSSDPLEPEGVTAERELAAQEAESETADSGPELFDFETAEGKLEEELPAAEPDDSDEFEGLGPAEVQEEPAETPEGGQPEEEHEEVYLDEQTDEPFTGEEELPPAEPAPVDTAETGDDLLSESPEFLEGDPEAEEDLWFEKGPPQDFDFEDDQK